MRKTISIISVALSLLLALVGCATVDTEVATLNLTPADEIVKTHTDLQEQYLSGNYLNIGNFAKGIKELSFPQAVTLQWDSVVRATYKLELSISQNFENSIIYTTTSPFYDVYNLYVGTQYFWRVSALVDGKVVAVSEVGTFTTADAAPRNLYVNGITNARDLGGWTTSDGDKIKQGLLYRTGRLNTSWQPDVLSDITPFGIDTMRNVLGIKSEIDLRKDYANEVSLMRESLLGKDINYYACPMEFDRNVLGTDSVHGNTEMLKKVFSVLADESNYPVFFHCDIGTDRTGMIAYLVLGYLGVNEEDIYRDYLFSNFARIGSSRDLGWANDCYIKMIKGSAGDTLSDKIENVLLGIGISADTLAAVREILL